MNTRSGKSDSAIRAILVAVAIALIAGGSAPWWWGKIFPPSPGDLRYRGSIRDSQSNLPVKGARVVPLGRPDLPPAQTDDFGTFSFKVPRDGSGGALLRLQITHPRYKESNYTVEVSADRVDTDFLLDPIEATEKEQAPLPVEKPHWPARFQEVESAELQVSEIDDIMTVTVNGVPVIRALYGQTPPWTNIKDFLHSGPNAIEVIIQNGQYGGCGGTLALRLNGQLNPDYRWRWEERGNQVPDIVCFQQVKTLNLD
jgi:hypothetical protein